MPATITQQELAEALESYNVALRQTDKFRLLLEAGAEVESGPLKVETDDELVFSGPCADTPCVSLGGVSIKTERANETPVLVNAGVDVNYQGISIDESGHNDPDDEELLRMDADGDEVVSVMPPMDIGSTVNVLLHHEVDPLIASRLLQKIAAIIETKGISTESWDCHTQHATVALRENHVKSLRITLETLRESE